MRCKCCDALNTRFILDDFYCDDCAGSIRETIKWDKSRDTLSWFENDIKAIPKEDDEDEEEGERDEVHPS